MSSLNRSDFLKIGGAFLKGLGIGTILSPVAVISLRNWLDNVEPENVSWLLNDEQLVAVQEIENYRRAQALEGLPQHLHYMRLLAAEKVSWDEPAEETQIEIPQAFHSYGDRVIEIEKIFFGKNGGRLVKSIKGEETLNASATFDAGSRYLSVDLAGDPNSVGNSVVTGHELIHAAQPDDSGNIQKTLYPKDILIKVTHGLTRILSQAARVPGKFMDDPYFYNVPNIKKHIGEGIARKMIEDDGLWGCVDDATAVLIENEISSLREASSDGQVIFSKSFCHRLGSLLLPKILDGSASLLGDFKKEWYDQHLELANMEIAAEMVEVLLANPQSIGGNEEIIGGLEEILSAIQGEKVDINIIISEVNKKSNVVAEKFEEELELQQEVIIRQAIEAGSGNEVIIELPEEPIPTEVAEMVGQIEEEEQKKDIFWDFILKGELPDSFELLSPELRKLMVRYGEAISSTYYRTPTITRGLVVDDLSFDPPWMHIWETLEVAEAWNSDVFYNLLNDPSLIEFNLEDIEGRIVVLNHFIDSFDRENIGKGG